jgi:hypothetical protein
LERSSSRSWIAQADRIAFGSLVLGLALYVMPWWSEGRLRVAFWLTLAATVFHIYTSHARGESEAE